MKVGSLRTFMNHCVGLYSLHGICKVLALITLNYTSKQSKLYFAVVKTFSGYCRLALKACMSKLYVFVKDARVT